MFGTSAIGLSNSITPKIETTEVRTMIMVQGNSVSGVSGLLTGREIELYDALESKDINRVLDEEVEYGELIKCLIQCESQFDPNATGDKVGNFALANGILQFHLDTFNRFSLKYGLDLDYKNPVHQIVLCDEMLTENFSNVWNWTNCYNSCK